MLVQVLFNFLLTRLGIMDYARIKVGFWYYEALEKILCEGGVTQQGNSIWLLDFWGKKDIAGILLMPPTRHVMLHLNDCCKWKEYIRTKKKFYRS